MRMGRDAWRRAASDDNMTVQPETDDMCGAVAAESTRLVVQTSGQKAWTACSATSKLVRNREGGEKQTGSRRHSSVPGWRV